MAKRASLGIGRMGGTASNGSGDIFVAFSTANPGADGNAGPVNVQMLGNDRLSTLFEATAQATEEAITNALVAARTLTGANGFTVTALPHDRLRAVSEEVQPTAVDHSRELMWMLHMFTRHTRELLSKSAYG